MLVVATATIKVTQGLETIETITTEITKTSHKRKSKKYSHLSL